jgi:hypothetical protein
VAPGRLRGNKVVIIGAEPTTYTQYETIRYINALAAICDGNIEVAINAGSGTWQVYPEQKAGRGTAIDPVPLSNYSGNTSGTVLKRVFQNMMVLINISNTTSSSMNFTGQGWFAISDSVDPTVNNGAALTTVTLPAWTARFYVKQQNAGAY